MSLALIAGAGALPAALAHAARTRPFVAALDGFAPEGLEVDLTFRIERLWPFFRALQDAGVTEVCFAGAVQRPRLDPALFDPITAQAVPRLMQAMAGGDDATLREVIALFEDEGFAIVSAAAAAPDLVPGHDMIFAGQLSERDRQDATRAAAITEALGRVDVGQGCVVAQGICLAAETIGGTDAMLQLVSQLPEALRPAPVRGKGLLYKAPKPLQDRRIDLPTLGPNSVDRVAAAGLGGIVWEAGGVICLDLPQMRQRAEAHGLFLWARSPAGAV